MSGDSEIKKQSLFLRLRRTANRWVVVGFG